MDNEEKSTVHVHHGPRGNRNAGVAGGVYGLGFIGAVVYYFSTATGFWMGVLGFLKAIVWPAFVIYKLMEFLKM